ncbi:cell wall hydrolase [Novosphingobium profundi]|uniref:cell wall hydrolase n=1 Tax=Novosphingobium profundi TaxID=1774954 RepID=UPI0031B9E804
MPTPPAPPDWIAPGDRRPADFHARITRPGRRGFRGSLAAATDPRTRARRQRRQRLAAGLLAVVALPAFASPSAWEDRFSVANAGSSALEVDPMPFEQAGSSFPGSAFYYLEPDKVVLGKGLAGASMTIGSALDPGPSAQALHILDVHFTSSFTDRTRALQCLTSAIYYEAASEPDAGQRAVAQVVLNRVAHPSYPNTVCGVVYEGSEKPTGCQFSFTCDGSLARKPATYFWNRAEDVAREALSGAVYRPVGLATHYHTLQVHPYWAQSLHALTTIGAHRFYSFAGPAGNAATFHYLYAGGEPAARPHPRTVLVDGRDESALADPLVVQQSYAWKAPLAAPGAGADKALQATPGSGGEAGSEPRDGLPAPAYTAQQRAQGGDARYRASDLPASSEIRQEFENSGRWLKHP